MWKLILAPLTLILFLMSFAAFAAEANPMGKKIFIKYKCTQCHTIEAAGVAKSEDKEEEEDEEEEEEADDDVKPPDLSGVGLEREPDWMVKYLSKKIKNDEGRKHKKKFKGSGKHLETLCTWLGEQKTKLPEKKEPTP